MGFTLVTRAFTFLMNGDVLPSVTTTQILLRRHRPQATIRADGNFGPRTKAAVEGFQSFHTLTRDGIVGDHSWNQFMSVSNFQTIDVVDGTDPSLVALEATDVRDAGGDPSWCSACPTASSSWSIRSPPAGVPGA